MLGTWNRELNKYVRVLPQRADILVLLTPNPLLENFLLSTFLWGEP